jgi:predicted DNA-binding transcriptional regulator AlpA
MSAVAAAEKRLLPVAIERLLPAAPERLLSPEQVAELLGVTEQTLAHWRCTRRVNLPFVAISRRCVRYRAGDVAEFITDRLENARDDS